MLSAVRSKPCHSHNGGTAIDGVQNFSDFEIIRIRTVATDGTSRRLIRFRRVTYEYLSDLARQWVAEQGDEASAHLAAAIRELRAVGDTRGAALLSKIAMRVDQLDGDPPTGGRRAPIRRHRGHSFDPSA